MIIASDTTSLIVLEKLESLYILCELFDKVLIPSIVLDEMKVGSPSIHHKLQEFNCLQITQVETSKRLNSLLSVLDAGEANAIELAIALELPLIIDERKGRQVAKQLGVKVTGFAGLLIQAKRKGILSATDAIALLDKAVENGLRLSQMLQVQVRTTLLV
ncbi:DUF3368 domain-containing protein [Leucothrix pacifica]|uniref:DUF3368 domain-containing protein n=1 Tax=Leucothrix pacifica TaxID=1247513 RepID=A0A317CLR6_9GAMM|nr:DUF3368 domain-containing protein [Leucothrix pacifica]PWQ99468.1 DUF3368 domain-containing protein [Leucothrix pacifica]